MTVFRRYYLKSSTTLLSVLNDWWNLLKRSLRMGDDAWCGNNIYEKMVYWYIGVPVLFLLFLLVGRLVGFVR